MARFEIKSKEGDLIRYSGKPRYNGSYLRPSYLEFSEIASPTPIAWEVGDYVDYPRTGMRYRLYSLPQPTKNARKGASGKAFTYSSVQLYAATKELEIALFKDLVTADNNIHFSTSPDVATFEDVYGIARRIQACMDYFYPERWEIKVADFDEIEDAEVLEKIRTAKDFAVSGGTCLDALSKIYELWQDIGWIHTYEDGKEVITIGYANKRIGVNTTESFLYGKGNGLTAIKKNQSNKEEFATRLYVYGSERNLPARYYNEKNILNAESVDIRHLMLPLDRWGTTDGLPDARKAYLENAEAVAKYGLIPKTHYFDSEDSGADIYPSIRGMTIGRLRKVLQDVGQTEYVPRLDIYPNDTERVDKVVVATTPSDNGVLKKNGNEHDITIPQYYISKNTDSINVSGQAGAEVVLLDKYPIAEYNIPSEGLYRAKVSMKIDRDCVVSDKGYSSVYANLTLSNGTNGSVSKTKKLVGIKEGNQWNINIGSISADYDDASYLNYVVNLNITVYAELGSNVDTNASVTITEGYITTTLDRIFDKTFNITLKQIGFDIDKKATEGSGKTISLKTGACTGRDFEIVESTYASSSDTWTIRCKRQQDDTLGMLFPNTDYRIGKDDEFVLVSIAMPEPYVLVNQERLMDEGLKLLAKASKAQYHYEPSIDAKVMVESARSIREGMFMEITDEDVVDNTTDYILIDTLSIYEDESAIPTYKVTLRERRKVTYKGTPSATSANETKSVGGDETIEVDLTGYATESYVNEKISGAFDEQGNDLANIKLRLDEAEKITKKFGFDDKGIYTDENFRSSKEISAGGAAEEGEGGGESGETTGEYRMYHHVQSDASKEWRIEHRLGKYPNVRIVDSNKMLCYGDVKYINDSVLTITFGAAEKGDAYCD